MKNLKTKLQSLRQRAEQLKQVVESAPARAERLRGAVHSAAGQFQQLRAEVQGTVSALRMNDDTQLAAALVEINDSEAVFLEAGYHLTGVDMEPGMAPRLLVHFEKLEEVRHAELLRLQKQHQSRPTLHALLSAMIKAEDAAGTVRLSGLIYSELTVHVGPVPSFQIGWRQPQEEPVAVATPEPAHSPTPPTEAAPVPPPLPGMTSGGSFFQPVQSIVPNQQAVVAQPSEAARASSMPTSQGTTVRVVQATKTPSRVTPLRLSSVSSVRPASESDPGSTADDWRKGALDRFKRMPKVG